MVVVAHVTTIRHRNTHMRFILLLIAASMVLSGCNSADKRISCEIKLPNKGSYPKIDLFALVDSQGSVNILSKQCGLARVSVFLSFEQIEKIKNEAKLSSNQGMLNDKVVKFDAIVTRKMSEKTMVVYKIENIQSVDELPEWLKPMHNY